MSEVDIVKQKYAMLRSAMDERLNRLWAASEALMIGWGGATLVTEATGISRATINAGTENLRSWAWSRRCRPRLSNAYPDRGECRVETESGGRVAVRN